MSSCLIKDGLFIKSLTFIVLTSAQTIPYVQLIRLLTDLLYSFEFLKDDNKLSKWHRKLKYSRMFIAK